LEVEKEKEVGKEAREKEEKEAAGVKEEAVPGVLIKTPEAAVGRKRMLVV
jgi:hypothetical protein